MSAAGDKPDAWMPLYVADWDAGTRRLTCEEDGAYGRLVRYYWKNGAPPDDDAQLARIVGVDRPRWRRLRPVLAAFFQVAEGRWTHGRVEAELAIWGEKRRRTMERAAAGGKARAAKAARGAGGAFEADLGDDLWTGFGGDLRAGEVGDPPATSSAQAQLKLSPSASASASAADERTPSQGILSSSVQAPEPTAHNTPDAGNAEASATAPSGTRADGQRAKGAPPARAQDGIGRCGDPGGRPVGDPVGGPGGKPRGALGGAPPAVLVGKRPDRAWPGPPDIRALVVATRGEAYAASYLDPAGWDPGDGGRKRLIIPRTGAAAERMRRDLRGVLEGVGVRVGKRAV